MDDEPDHWNEACCPWCGTLACGPCDCGEPDPLDEPPPPGRGNRERHLELKGELKCDWCSPGHGCNSHGKRVPHPDRYKSKRKGK